MSSLTRIALVALLVAGCAPLEEGVAVEAPPQPAAPAPLAPPPPAPSPAPATPSRAPGPPTEAEARAKLGEAVQACGAETERGYLALQLRVKPAGDVSAVNVQASTLATPGRVRCLREHLQAVPFEAFELPSKPKSREMSCLDDSPNGMFDCKPLPYDAVTVDASGVIEPDGSVRALGALPTADLFVELFTEDLRWARDGGRPQVCFEGADPQQTSLFGGSVRTGKGWCFILSACTKSNGYAGLQSPRQAEGAPCDPLPKDAPRRVKLSEAYVMSAPPEVVRRHRR